MSKLFVSLLLAALSAGATAADAPARETRSFRLYKFQQAIGLEETIRAPAADGSTELRTTFSFTDRRTSVPLATALSLAADGTPRRLQIWGSTSRFSRIDDAVELRGGRIEIVETGAARSVDA